MGGYLPGALQAPLTRAIILMEMIRDPGLVGPLMLTTLIARLVSGRIMAKPIHHPAGADVDAEGVRAVARKPNMLTDCSGWVAGLNAFVERTFSAVPGQRDVTAWTEA